MARESLQLTCDYLEVDLAKGARHRGGDRRVHLDLRGDNSRLEVRGQAGGAPRDDCIAYAWGEACLQRNRLLQG